MRHVGRRAEPHAVLKYAAHIKETGGKMTKMEILPSEHRHPASRCLISHRNQREETFWWGGGSAGPLFIICPSFEENLVRMTPTKIIPGRLLNSWVPGSSAERGSSLIRSIQVSAEVPSLFDTHQKRGNTPNVSMGHICCGYEAPYPFIHRGSNCPDRQGFMKLDAKRQKLALRENRSTLAN